MNRVEMMAKKKELIASSGLTAGEWQSWANERSERAGTTFIIWMETGGYLEPDPDPIPKSTIFTESNTANKQKTAEVLPMVAPDDTKIPEWGDLTYEEQEALLSAGAEQSATLVDEEPVTEENIITEAANGVSENKEIVIATATLEKQKDTAAISEQPKVASTPRATPVAPQIMSLPLQPINISGELVKDTAFQKAAAPNSIEDAQLFRRVEEDNTAGVHSVQEINGWSAEFVEDQVSRMCQLAGVPNLALSAFGIYGKSLEFKQLSVLEYGGHKFLGSPFSQQDVEAIVFRLGLYFQQTPDTRVAISAVIPIVTDNNFTFYSVLFTDEIIKKFVNATQFAAYISTNEPDVSKLVLVVDKCQKKTSILK